MPEMRTVGERFLSLIDYSGVGEVEFMRDPRDGVYKLLEVNPRFWGWHSLAIAAGIDLPYLWYRDATQEYLPWQTRRFDVSPGMTGLWQVTGKNKTTFKEMIRLDISYVEHLSLWLDCRILSRTLSVVISQVRELKERRRQKG